MRFSIILADPPWEYDNDLSGRVMNGAITYPTMSTNAIAKIPVRDIRADDSVLFMWATMPKLEDAFKVIRGWGFQYVTCAFVWIKQNKSSEGIFSGMGYWTNQNAELVLLGKHGKPQRVAKNIKQVIMAPVGRHSAKPPEIRERIVQLMGDLPRVELFARDLTPGWTCLGNEVDGNDIRDSIEFLAYLSTSV
jgi:N6-adenosine-specific RNA methylase IME4